jgi:hypothetical protein
MKAWRAKRLASADTATQQRRIERKAKSAWKKRNPEYRRWIAKGLPLPTRPMPDACECCGRLGSGNAQYARLCLDHNHTTGEFRGWLCHQCNAGLGLLGDGYAGLRCAMNYLNKADLL